MLIFKAQLVLSDIWIKQELNFTVEFEVVPKNYFLIIFSCVAVQYCLMININCTLMCNLLFKITN